MAWVRLGDDAASNGTVLAVLEDDDADDRSPEEVFGYVMLLASVSAVHYQDYAVSMGQAIQQARSKDRATRLLHLAARAGYGELQRDTATGRVRFLLKDDANFIHMITQAEKDWMAQQKADNSNPTLIVQVRRRDGDACRYCGVVVSWSDRKGGRGGTYDHRPPGRPAAGPEHLYVACRQCNGDRGQASQGLDPTDGLAAADELLPPYPQPHTPYFRTSTVEWFEKHRSILIQFGLTVPPRPSKDLRPGTPAPGTAPAPAQAGVRAPEADTAPTGVRPAPQDPAPAPGVRPSRPQPEPTDPAPTDPVCDPSGGRWQPVDATAEPAPTQASADPPNSPETAPGRSRQIPADHRTSGSGYAGSGRDGKGSDGTRSGRDGAQQPGRSPRRRRRRGRRSGQQRKPSPPTQGRTTSS